MFSNLGGFEMRNSNRSAEKESFWRIVLEKHQRSGLTVRAFSKKEGISEPSFYAWRKKIKQRDATLAPEPTVEQQTLIPVSVVDRASSPRHDVTSLLEVVTPSGFTLRFRQDIEPQQLNMLLRVVASCQSGAVPC